MLIPLDTRPPKRAHSLILPTTEPTANEMPHERGSHSERKHGSGGSWSARGSWQATAGAWAASSWRGAEGATTITRERATAASEVQSWAGVTSLAHLHTYKFSGDTDMPPLLIFMFVCIIVFFLLLFFGSAYLHWSRLNDKRPT